MPLEAENFAGVASFPAGRRPCEQEQHKRAGRPLAN